MTSGHRAFRQHAEYAEGSDTASTSHPQKSPCAEREKCNMGRLKRVLRSPAGLRHRKKRTHAIGVYPLSPAVLLPDEERSDVLHGYTRVKPRVSARKALCAIFIREPSVYPLSQVKPNVRHL